MRSWIGSHFHDYSDFYGVAFSAIFNRVTRIHHILKYYNFYTCNGSIHKYSNEISVVYSVCSTCHHCIESIRVLITGI